MLLGYPWQYFMAADAAGMPDFSQEIQKEHLMTEIYFNTLNVQSMVVQAIYSVSIVR